ncbi:hypothetical protein G6F61_014821 [Rhizopus arrhizus]|nr:hypothetical protein G6F61_014821 [Rhizopus arrhizus]
MIEKVPARGGVARGLRGAARFGFLRDRPHRGPDRGLGPGRGAGPRAGLRIGGRRCHPDPFQANHARRDRALCAGLDGSRAAGAGAHRVSAVA